MSDKLVKVANSVKISGKVAELEVKHGQSKSEARKGEPYIMIRGAVQFDEKETVCTKKFRTMLMAKNSSGAENKNYAKAVEWAKNAKSVASVGWDEATPVVLAGTYSDNAYVGSNGMLYEGTQIDVTQFWEVREDRPFYTECDIEGYIKEVKPETKKVEDETVETGRLRVTMVTFDFFGNAIVINNIVVPEEFVPDFAADYEIGKTAKLYAEYQVHKGEQKVERKGGLGKPRVTEGKSYLELVLTGTAYFPISPDEEGAISPETVKIALAERKAKHDAIKEAGETSGSISTSTTTRSGLGGSKAPASTTTATAVDMDEEDY